MKDILTAPFVREMCETTANMYRLGWDERNGGNISYVWLDKERAVLQNIQQKIPPWHPLVTRTFFSCSAAIIFS